MRPYRRCNTCVLDTTDLDISFDNEGVCNHCNEWLPRVEKLPKTSQEAEKNLLDIKKKIQKNTKSKKYDCLIGLSGGVDSSYIVYLAHKLGLKPLIVHFDNGWNSELAISNIEKVVTKCNFEYNTLIVDWDEFRELQVAYLKASVVDIEVATDHAIIATMFKLAKKYNIKYILSGGNIATETGMPYAWTWPKKDLTNLKNIHKKFSKVPLKTYPTRNIWKALFDKKFSNNVEDIRILDHINYTKSDAIKLLENEFGWQYYGGKHFESVFTKFYQSYILPRKFNIDKRLVHLSSLIRNKEITRDEALLELEKDLYSAETLKLEMEYVLKKLQLSKSDFEEIMNMEPVSHLEFGSDYIKMEKIKKIYRFFFKKKSSSSL